MSRQVRCHGGYAEEYCSPKSEGCRISGANVVEKLGERASRDECERQADPDPD